MSKVTLKLEMRKLNTVWNVSKYGVFSSPYFPAFGLNTGKYGPEKTPYLDTFHAVKTSTSTEYHSNPIDSLEFSDR